MAKVQIQIVGLGTCTTELDAQRNTHCASNSMDETLGRHMIVFQAKTKC